MVLRKNSSPSRAAIVRLAIIVITGLVHSDAFTHGGLLDRPNLFPLTRRIQRQPHSRIENLNNPLTSKESDSNVFMKEPYQWEGDDIRWIRKLRRRWREILRELQPAKVTFIITNSVFFLYQVVNAIQNARRRYPAYWPRQAHLIMGDTLIGASIAGPFTMDFVYSNDSSLLQPHRYITSGFLHGSILHLLINMDSLRRIPSWLETGLGWPLYVTAYLTSIITGNMAFSWLSKSSFDATLCLGASGGICGLYGLMFIALAKMGNTRATKQIATRMGFLLLYGLLFENISNAAHAGGFLGGALIGLIFGPNYRRSYGLRRKWSLEVDAAPREYRDVMGFGYVPTTSGTLPIQALWIVAVLVAASQPKFRSIPSLILKGLLQPGSLKQLLNR